MNLRASSAVRLLILLLLWLWSASTIEAVPLEGPNGHFYDFVSGNFTWDAARAAALSQSHLGQPGYLATVTSAAEEAFIATLAPIGWLGGTDQAVEGVWRWADGPEANQIFWNGGPGGSAPPGTFTNWGAGQPDNGGVQNFLLRGPGGWDDFGGTQPYYVEFDPAPEPTTLLLLGSTFAGVGMATWKKRQHRVRSARAMI